MIGIDPGECLGAKSEFRILPFPRVVFVGFGRFELREVVVFLEGDAFVFILREEIPSGDRHRSAVGWGYEFLQEVLDILVGVVGLPCGADNVGDNGPGSDVHRGIGILLLAPFAAAHLGHPLTELHPGRAEPWPSLDNIGQLVHCQGFQLSDSFHLTTIEPHWR